MPSQEVGRRIASRTQEGKGYFFTSLDFITEEHLAKGLFIGDRKSKLLEKPRSVDMKDVDQHSQDLYEIVEDCDTESGSNYCGPELRVAKSFGVNDFLHYMNAFCPSPTLYIYKVKDIV